MRGQYGSVQEIPTEGARRASATCGSQIERIVGNASLADDTLEPQSEHPPTPEPRDVEYEVEGLVGKGRIGKRVWYKVKWKDYPASANTWVKRIDIGEGARAVYEVSHPNNLGELEFEAVVGSREVDGVMLYEVSWKERPPGDNLWVSRWDISAKAIATFESGSTRS
jgi:hypothetical protein